MTKSYEDLLNWPWHPHVVAGLAWLAAFTLAVSGGLDEGRMHTPGDWLAAAVAATIGAIPLAFVLLIPYVVLILLVVSIGAALPAIASALRGRDPKARSGSSRFGRRGGGRLV